MIWNIDMLDFVLFMVSDFKSSGCLKPVEIYTTLEVCLIWFQNTEKLTLNVELKQSFIFVLTIIKLLYFHSFGSAN